MKLIDVVRDIENIEDDLIIFQENLDLFDSDVILASAEEGDQGIKNEDGKKYYYLLEVFLSKEFIEDWIQSLDYTPNSEEIAKRLHQYAIHDA